MFSLFEITLIIMLVPLNDVSGSNLSIFYFSLNPKLTDTNFKKSFVLVEDNLTHKTFESAMNILQTSIEVIDLS